MKTVTWLSEPLTVWMTTRTHPHDNESDAWRRVGSAVNGTVLDGEPLRSLA